MCIDSKFLVFVYGTLKQGFPNDHLNQGQKFSGSFQTFQRYPFYLVGQRYSPCLIDSPSTGEFVHGEIYRVSKSQLDILDQLERIDQADGYKRKKIILNDEHQKKLEAFVYLKPVKPLNHDDLRIGPLTKYERHHADIYKVRKKFSNRYLKIKR